MHAFLVVVVVAAAFIALMFFVRSRMGRWPWESDPSNGSSTRGGSSSGKPPRPK